MNVLEAAPDRRFPDTTFDLEAEQTLLACCFLNLSILASASAELEPRDFASPLNSAIFHAIQTLQTAATGVNRVTVVAELERQGYDKTQTVAYIGGLTHHIPILEDWRAYAGIVKDKSTRRGLGIAGKRLVQLAADPSKDVVESLSWAQTIAPDLASREPVTRGLEELYEARRSAFAEAGSLNASRPVWPIKALHDGLAPMRGGALHVVAGYTGFGKSSLVLRTADFNAAERGIPGAIFSLEMGRAQCLARLCRHATGKSPLNTPDRYGKNLILSDDEFEEWAFGRQSVPLYFPAALKYAEICAEIRRLVITKGIKLAVVDWLGLIQGMEWLSEAQRYPIFCNGFKALARELDIEIILVVQMNREGVKADRLLIQHIKGSGGVGDAADTVLILNKSDKHRPNPGGSFIFDCDFGKQREGSTGLSCELFWDHEYVMPRDVPRSA